MSLLRPVIRACAVAALRDKSWAESRVYDSNMTPLADALTGHAHAPYIVVYTDTDDVAPVPGVAEIYDGGETRRLNLVLEVGVASAIAQADGTSKIVFAPSDFGMELAVDVVCYQALAALFGDTSSKWGEMLKRFVLKLQRMPTRRGGQGQVLRYAARRITLTCSTIFDFAPGIVPPANHPVWDFIRLANAEPLPGPPEAAGTIKDMANIISRLLAATAAPDWRQAQTLLGLTTRGVRHLMVPGTPLPIPNTEEPPLDWSDKNEFVPPLADIVMTGGTEDTTVAEE